MSIVPAPEPVDLGTTIDLRGLRRAGAAMLGLGAILPLLPHHPGLPCPLRTLTGVPCPLCGMSTAVEYALAGRLGESITANPYGLIAVAVAVLLLIRPGPRRVRVPIPLVAAMAATSWIWELRRFGVI